MKCLNKQVELGNVLVDMYAKCGELEKVLEVFDELCVHDIVSMECFDRWICSPRERKQS